ncbi:MAG: O-antigen ligase family protein [Chloroflexota bacterium]
MIDAIARWLARLEIVLLALVYIYFVVTDQVPLGAFALIALIWIARWRVAGTLTRRTPFDLPILLLLVWLPVSFSVTVDAASSLPKVYGVILCIAFFYALVNAIRTRRDLAWATLWLVSVCAAIALAGLVGTDWAQGKIVSASFIYDHLPRFVQNIPRSIAGGFARNGVGGTLAFTIPLLAALAVGRTTDDRRRSAVSGHWSSVVLIALVFSLVTLVLTQSRGGILGTVAGLLMVAVWRERRFVWVIGAGVFALIALLALGYGGVLLDFALRMDARSATLASRLEVWQRGLMMVRDFPYTGIGIGTYNMVAHLMYPFFIAAPDEVVAHAHNQFLQVAVDLGIPGLSAYIGLLVAFGTSAVRAYRANQDANIRALIIGLVAGMFAHHVFGLTDAFILGTKPGIVMWIFFAFVAAIDQRPMTDDGRFDHSSSVVRLDLL